MKTIFIFFVALISLPLLSQEAACRDLAPECPITPGAPIMLLDFGMGKACPITKAREKELLAAGFALIRSRFGSKGFSIFVWIRRKPFRFRFDTAYQGTFSMPFSQSIPFIKDAHQTLDGESGFYSYPNRWITVNGIHYSSAITVSTAEKHPRVGLAFIKGFDWIVDTKNKKVYIRKNSLPIGG